MKHLKLSLAVAATAFVGLSLYSVAVLAQSSNSSDPKTQDAVNMGKGISYALCSQLRSDKEYNSLRDLASSTYSRLNSYEKSVVHYAAKLEESPGFYKVALLTFFNDVINNCPSEVASLSNL
jgi:hypothetical protein